MTSEYSIRRVLVKMAGHQKAGRRRAGIRYVHSQIVYITNQPVYGS
jgi:hypothetical protein